VPSEQIRAYIYRILMAVGAVVAFYGILSNEEIVVWLGLAAVILNVLPATNTTTKPHE
jgi:hypothetical protein